MMISNYTTQNSGCEESREMKYACTRYINGRNKNHYIDLYVKDDEEMCLNVTSVEILIIPSSRSKTTNDLSP